MTHPISKEQAVQLAREAGATPYTNRHYPDRPTHTFNVEQLEAFATNAYKLGRNAGLDEAQQICTELAELNRKAMTDSMWQQEECAAAIESLKDNTP